jgi:hypothetical protein
VHLGEAVVQAGAFAGEGGIGVLDGIAAKRGRSGDGDCFVGGGARLHQSFMALLSHGGTRRQQVEKRLGESPAAGGCSRVGRENK